MSGLEDERRAEKQIRALCRALEVGYGWVPDASAAFEGCGYPMLKPETLEGVMTHITFPKVEGAVGYTVYRTVQPPRTPEHVDVDFAVVAAQQLTLPNYYGPAYCGFCGKTVYACSCPPEEKTPKMEEAPPEPEAKVVTSAKPMAVLDQLQDKLVAEVSLPPVTRPCYYCADTKGPKRHVRSTGAVICGPCAVLHLL